MKHKRKKAKRILISKATLKRYQAAEKACQWVRLWLANPVPPIREREYANKSIDAIVAWMDLAPVGVKYADPEELP